MTYLEFFLFSYLFQFSCIPLNIYTVYFTISCFQLPLRTARTWQHVQGIDWFAHSVFYIFLLLSYPTKFCHLFSSKTSSVLLSTSSAARHTLRLYCIVSLMEYRCLQYSRLFSDEKSVFPVNHSLLQLQHKIVLCSPWGDWLECFQSRELKPDIWVVPYWHN